MEVLIHWGCFHKAVCHADIPNQHTAADRNLVTCTQCKTMMALLLATDRAGTVTIRTQDYNEMRKDSITMRALEAGGVDNWQWFDLRWDTIREWAAEDDEIRELFKDHLVP